jgi:ribonuclease HI
LYSTKGYGLGGQSRLVDRIVILPDEVYGAKDPVAKVYCDGGVMQINPSPLGAAWAWCHTNDKNVVLTEESGLLLPSKTWPQITNNYAEYVACLRALEALPDDWHGSVYTDSNVTIGRMSKGWATEGIPELLVTRARHCLSRLGVIDWYLLDGHPTRAQLREGYGKRGNPVSIHNVWCDEQCSRLMLEYAKTLHGEGNG